MQWHKAQFKLQNGDKFTIAHALPKAGPNNIDDAFQIWCDTHLAVDGSADPAGDFIRYINAHTAPHVRACNLETYEKMTAGTEFTDKSLMPFGQHKNKKLIDVPADYLIYIYDKGYINNAGLAKYVQDNMTVLKTQSKAIKR